MILLLEFSLVFLVFLFFFGGGIDVDFQEAGKAVGGVPKSGAEVAGLSAVGAGAKVESLDEKKGLKRGGVQ